MKSKSFFALLITLFVMGVLVFSFKGINSPGMIQGIETGTFTDTRDGKIYKTIKIGDQWMMSENLAYKPNQGNYWSYNNDTANVALYGYLYDWETAKSVAPTGWHLPTVSDWKALRKALGGKRDVYKKLGGTMEKVFTQMTVGGCGFNALMAGFRTGNGEFKFLGERTFYWSSSPSRDGQYFYMLDAKIDRKPHGFFDSEEGTAALATHMDHAQCGQSVRLFKD
jgi:uncharacterized protein (TIGR02145 family)